MTWRNEDECLCAYEGPDENGQYDLIENPACPLHGSGEEAA